jgi:hypothetical protein
VAKPGEHPADLAVLPFGQHHLENARMTLVPDQPNPLRPDFTFGEPDPLRQLLEDLAPGLAGDDDAVDLLDAEFGVRELVGELAVVGEEHQAGALLVEPAHRVSALGDLGKEVDDAWFAGRVVVG